MTKKDQEAYDKVMSKWNYVNSAMTATFKRYNDLEDLYFFHTPKRKNSAKSNVFDPMAYEQVEHNVSHLYANPPKGEFVPVPEGLEDLQDIDLQLVLPLMNELMRYQWERRDADMFRKMATVLRRASIYGVGWAVMHWRYERMKDENSGKMMTIWDDWCMYPISNYDVWPDIDAETAKEMEFFIHDEYVTLDYLESQVTPKGEKRYKNLEEIKKKHGEEKGSGTTIDNPYRNNLMVRTKVNTLGQMEGRIKVRRCYYKDRWISICPDYNVLIEDGPNRYKNNRLPVLACLDQDVPGVVLGIGEIDPVRTLMMAMNQFINMRMDNIKMNMERPMVARKSALEHMKTWLWKRNNVMIVNQDGDLKMQEVQDVTGPTFIGTLTWLQDVIRTRLGRTDLLSTTRANRTATEIDAITEEQNARKKYKVNNLEDFIKDIIVTGMQMNQMFLKNERWLRIMGVKNVEKVRMLLASDPDRLKMINDSLAFLNFKQQDILSQFDYVVETGSTLLSNNARDIQNSNAIIQTGMGLNETLALQGKVFDPTPILNNISSKMGIKDSLVKPLQMPQNNTLAGQYNDGQGIGDDVTQFGQDGGVPIL